MGSKKMSLVSKWAIFHFHDCGKKSKLVAGGDVSSLQQSWPWQITIFWDKQLTSSTAPVCSEPWWWEEEYEKTLPKRGTFIIATPEKWIFSILLIESCKVGQNKLGNIRVGAHLFFVQRVVYSSTRNTKSTNIWHISRLVYQNLLVQTHPGCYQGASE